MQRPSWRNFDPLLLASAVALVCFGLTVLSSATRVDATTTSSLFVRQIILTGVGLVIFVSLSFVDYRVVGQLSPILYIGTIGVLFAVFALGTFVMGAQRWLELGGVRLQPSEAAKLVTVVVLARWFAGRAGVTDTTGIAGAEVPAQQQTVRSWMWTNAGALLLVAPIIVLVYLQPDLGTALVVGAAYFSVAYVAGVPHRILGGLVAIPLVGFPVVWQTLRPYMRNRILSFLAPDRDPLGEGYNLIQARISVGSGGWWGRGLGNGTQTQLSFLRVQHTDFIFAVIGEELGFFGGVGLICLYGFLFWRCLRVLARSRDAFGRYLVGGVIGMTVFQAFVNIAMNVGLLPVTGIPLPFISYGGSSLLTLFASLGLLQSVLVHAQTRRYDSRPSVGVPTRGRLRAGRFTLDDLLGNSTSPALAVLEAKPPNEYVPAQFGNRDPTSPVRRVRMSADGDTEFGPGEREVADPPPTRHPAEAVEATSRRVPNSTRRRTTDAPEQDPVQARERAALRLRRNSDWT